MTEPAPLQQIDRTYVRLGRRKLACFSGCDYFRLASHPKVLAAAQSGIKQFGLNVAASRLTTGNHALYGQLESRLADFFQAPGATLVSSGYATNLTVAQALAGNFSHALIDERSHPSLADAASFLNCPVFRFHHRDPQDLANCVRRLGPGARLIVLTDGMFSHDGSAAPLQEYLAVLPQDGLILVDDAHGAGVLGPTGKGTLEHAGVTRRRVLQTLTLSKAFGAYGGAILAPPALRQRILDRSRLFVGSTPLPLPLASAALQAIRLLKSDRSFRRRLTHNAAYVKESLRQHGFPLADTPGPIVPLIPQRPAAAAKLKCALLHAGILPPFIKYPTGPHNGFFRFVLSSEHTRPQLNHLLQVLTHKVNPADFCH